MASTPFMSSLLDVWAVWNIRGFMIFSLVMQVLLAIMSPFRKVTSNRWVILVIWSAYFLADWITIFVFGLITNAKCKNPASGGEVDRDLLALWSAFLLIHLGGPDSITAYALEDSTLWLRHLVGLIVQVLAFLNIFIKTLPDNKVCVPTILIAIAGTVKYGERTRALYLSSVENLKDLVIKSSHVDLNTNTRPEGVTPRSNSDGHNNGVEILKGNISKAFHFFQIFKCLISNLMPDHSQWQESRDFFLQQDAKTSFEILVLEQKFFYDTLYTKILAANSLFGVIIRALAFYCVFVALIMFCLMKKEGIHGVDIRITYLLLAGVIALDFANERMLIESNWTTMDATYLRCLEFVQGLIISVINVIVTLLLCLLAIICCPSNQFYPWSNSSGALSLLKRGFEESRPREGCELRHCLLLINGKMNDKFGVVLSRLPYQWKNKFDMTLWDFVFIYLKEKARTADDEEKVRAVYEARGEGTIHKRNLTTELNHYVSDFDFEKTLLIWHCATEICYEVNSQVDEQRNQRRNFSKILSEYTTYLLIKQPKLMSSVAGIKKIRYDDTSAEVKDIGMKHPSEGMMQFCNNILNEHRGTAESDDRRGKGNSVLSDACNLADVLRPKSDKWDIISEVWVELLSYAALHCQVDSHARLLSEGGEFITFVWLLMAHFGIIPRFPRE